ncbi:MAG TPA: helix-turn-helix transcriptional regulator [Solirubrobacteraceae bacterium]|jgi:transcriptional regulator with XRE-family HTH domain|nr:helix-turn-helix transcriptional regulator [Solirubrobacteraceae bacterium]
MTPGQLIRDARRSAGLSQQALASRMSTTQSAIAGLESDRSSPRVSTVERALRACGRELSLTAARQRSSIDETLVAANLRYTPEQRLLGFERSYANMRELALAGARARGELA